jgi:hypothetical protein
MRYGWQEYRSGVPCGEEARCYQHVMLETALLDWHNICKLPATAVGALDACSAQLLQLLTSTVISGRVKLSHCLSLPGRASLPPPALLLLLLLCSAWSRASHHL